MAKQPRTVVEFRDYVGAEDAPCHKVARVFINGTEVMAQKDSLKVSFGPNGETAVTLTLLPTEVHFTH